MISFFPILGVSTLSSDILHTLRGAISISRSEYGGRTDTFWKWKCRYLYPGECQTLQPSIIVSTGRTDSRYSFDSLVRTQQTSEIGDKTSTGEQKKIRVDHFHRSSSNAIKKPLLLLKGWTDKLWRQICLKTSAWHLQAKGRKRNSLGHWQSKRSSQKNNSVHGSEAHLFRVQGYRRDDQYHLSREHSKKIDRPKVNHCTRTGSYRYYKG